MNISLRGPGASPFLWDQTEIRQTNAIGPAVGNKINSNGSRNRRSPCLDGLLAACRRGPVSRGEDVIRDLVRDHDSFFHSSDLLSRAPVLRYKADVNKILTNGFVRPTEEDLEMPFILQDWTDQQKQEFLLHARANALQNLLNDASNLASSSAPSGRTFVEGRFDFEIDPDLAERQTGYPLEKPADTIRIYGAQLIDSGLVSQSLLRTVAAQKFIKPIFLGPWTPPEAIVGILQNGKYIWRRPTGAIQSATRRVDTRFGKILNVAINPDDKVALAQRYLHRKHPDITDNYTFRSSTDGNSSSQLERMGPQPNLNPLPSKIRINILGSGNSSSSPLGETSFSNLRQNLVKLIEERRLQSEIGLDPAVSLDFVGCESLSEQQINHIQNDFRNHGLSIPTVSQYAMLEENGRSSADLDFVLSLSPEQFTVGAVRKIKRLHPTAVVYNLRKLGPNVRNAVLYRQIPRTTPSAPQKIRINVISHGEGVDMVGGTSLFSLGEIFAARIRQGQLTGEFHPQAKITLNFVSCGAFLSPGALSSLYQAFKAKKIQLANVHYRRTKLLVDTAGRKLQEVDGEWAHAHRKRIIEFDANGNLSELPELPIPDPPDFLILQGAAGPLSAKAEGQYHIQQFTEDITALKRERNLAEGWRPDLGSLTKIGDKQYRINFRKDGEMVTVTTEKTSLEEFNQFIKTHTEAVGALHRLEGDELKPIEPQTNTDASEVATGSRLNRLLTSMAAFRTLLDADGSLRSPYTNEIRARALVNLAQSVHVLGNEGVDLVGNLRSLLIQNSSSIEITGGLSAVRFLRGANRLAGRGLMVANIGFDLYELTQARTSEEKIRSGLLLGLDGAFLGLEVASIAGIAAAGPLALLLGFGLLAYEFLGWGSNQTSMHNEETVYRYFESLKRAYSSEKTMEYDVGRDVLRFAPGAIITEVTMDGQPSIQLDSQKLKINKVLACSINSESSIPNVQISSREIAHFLNIRSEMGWPDRKPIPSQAALASNVLLPVSPKTNLHYTYRTADNNDEQLRQSEGARILQQLAQKYPDLQLRACTAVIGLLTPVYQETQIKVALGLRDRTLLMPSDLSKEVARCLKYTLEGRGGNYRLLPARNAEFALRQAAQTESASNWIIDLSSLKQFDDLNYTLTAETLTFHDAVRGSIKIHIAGVSGNIEVQSKLRKWRLDRTSNQLRLVYMDFGGSEVPQSRGTILRNEINRQLERLSTLRSESQTNVDQGAATESALRLVFQNQAIPISDYLYLDSFPLGGTPQTVIHDIRNKALITSGSDKLPNPKFIGQAGSSFYFSMGRMFWKGSAPGQPSSREQSLFFEQARNHILKAWKENGITFISQTIPFQKMGDWVEAIYQLNDDGTPLLIKLTVRSAEFCNRIRSGRSISASVAFRYIEEIATTPRPLLPSALITTATQSNLISLVCWEQQGNTQRFWLDTTHNELVSLDGSLPADALPVAKTDSGGIFFYSSSTKNLYRRTSSQVESLLFIGGVHTLKLVEGRLQVENNDGLVYEITGEGKKRLIAIGSRWREARLSTWTTDLEQLTREGEVADSISIQGLKLADGQTFFCWYDRFQKRFTLASNKISNEKLLHLGAVSPDRGAWLFQPKTRRLFQQPTFTAEWMKLLISHPDQLLPATALLAEPTPVFPQEKFEHAAYFQDGRVIARTQSGLTLLLEPGMTERPLVLAVNSNWMSREANQRKHLAHFTRDEDFRFHWNIDLPVSESQQGRSANWYDIAAQKFITIPTKKLVGGLDYVGYATSDDTIYCGNQTKLIALQSNANQQLSVTETPFQAPNRDRNILSLQVRANGSPQNKVPPILAGIDTLLLQGHPDGLTINQELWNHHRLIVLNRMPASHERSDRLDNIDLQFSSAKNLRLKRLKEDLVLELPNQSHSTRLTFKDFFAAGRTWNLSFHLSDGSRRTIRSQEISLQADETKPLVELSEAPASGSLT